MALHESLGFRHLGVYRGVGWKHGSWWDVGWWQRRLAAPAAPSPPSPLTEIPGRVAQLLG